MPYTDALGLLPDSCPPLGRGWAAAAASILEASAPKPGNVHPTAAFPDLTHAELVAAGLAIASPMQAATDVPLGRTILSAVTAARLVTRSNANLGIVLAIAPMAAVAEPGDGGDDPLASAATGPAAVAQVLSRLGPDDAVDVWRAIALARPGGMGTSDRHDVAGPPPDDLLAAMRQAAPRDSIARLWTEGYGPLYAGLVADLLAAIDLGLTLDDAIVDSFLAQLAREPDSLITRRHGLARALDVSRRAGEARGDRLRIAEFDRFLRSPLRLNPGTTADLTAAALYILIRSGRLQPDGPLRGQSLSTNAMTNDTRTDARIPADGHSAPDRDEAYDEAYTVRLRKAVHVFCAGHFITLTDDLCEAVHGHNWLVGADVEGAPDAHGMVVDFIKLRDLLSRITARLDHRMLLPTRNRRLVVSSEAGPSVDGHAGSAEVTVRFQNRRWVFPADECVLLPVENTTAEWLARWIGHELLGAMAASGSPIMGRLRIEVDECLGQSAVWELKPR